MFSSLVPAPGPSSARDYRARENKMAAGVGDEIDPKRAEYIDQLLAKYRERCASSTVDEQKISGEVVHIDSAASAVEGLQKK